VYFFKNFFKVTFLFFSDSGVNMKKNFPFLRKYLCHCSDVFFINFFYFFFSFKVNIAKIIVANKKIIVLSINNKSNISAIIIVATKKITIFILIF